MSRNVLEKLANEEQLDEDDVAYARDHGIALPEEYGVADTSYQVEPGTTPVPVVSSPQYPAAPSEPGLFLTPDQLGGLTKANLEALAMVAEIETGGTKADIIADLTGGSSSAEEEVVAEEPA